MARDAMVLAPRIKKTLTTAMRLKDRRAKKIDKAKANEKYS